MGLTFFIIAACLIFGSIAALASFHPNLIPDIGASLRRAEPIKKFSPKNTLFIIGPAVNHPACRIQRKLLKPAIPVLIREDVTVIEIYGEDQPRKNGAAIDWLDHSLLRHALNAETGFTVLYVNDAGKVRFRSEAPMINADILRLADIDISSPGKKGESKSAVLKKLRAA